MDDWQLERASRILISGAEEEPKAVTRISCDQQLEAPGVCEFGETWPIDADSGHGEGANWNIRVIH